MAPILMAPQNAARNSGVSRRRQEHALLPLDPEVAERVAGAVHQLLERPVGERAVLVEEGHPAAPALGHVAVHEEGGGVEPLGELGHRCRHRQRRFRAPRRRPAGFRFPAGFPLAATRDRAGAADALTAIASISTRSSGFTRRETTSKVLGG